MNTTISPASSYVHVASDVDGASPALASYRSVVRQRIRAELTAFRRTPVAVFFSILFPLQLLLLFGSIFGNEMVRGVRNVQVLAAGALVNAVASTSFLSTAISVSIERSEGTLKRLWASPMPRSAYFVAKVVVVGITTTVSATLMMLVSRYFFHTKLPSTTWKWFTLIWVSVLGVASCTLIAIALSSIIRSPRQAGPIANAPFVLLNFLSGVYISFWDLPKPLQFIGSLFPLKWMAQGYRAATLPDTFTAQEVAQSWEHGRIAFVLSLWCVFGLIACAKSFRWWPGQDKAA